MKDGIIQDSRGRILGRWSARRPLTPKQRKFVTAFLIPFYRENGGKEKVVDMEKGELVNQVKLAGLVKSVKVQSKDRAFFIVDCDNKRVPCSVYQDEMSRALIERFEDGDYIQLVGRLNPWSKKDDDTGEWTNGMNVQVHKIMNEPPKRATKPAPKQTAFDDDIPF